MHPASAEDSTARAGANASKRLSRGERTRLWTQLVRGRGIAPANVYPCSDGEYLIAANGDGVFRRLAGAMGRPELADDARYRDHAARGRHQRELDGLIADWTRGLTVSEVNALMTRHGVPAGRIYAPEDMLQDPHFASRKALIEFPDHPRWPGLVMQNAFPKFSRNPFGVRQLAPQTVGEHNAQVFGRVLGLDAAELERLAAQGVI